MISRYHRLKVLRRLAQATSGSGAPPSPASPTAANVPTTPAIQPQPVPINIQSLPLFNPNLFSAKPAIIGIFNAIANKLNEYLLSLSAGKVNFNLVFTNPSISGSEYTNSMKNMLNLSKWLYGILTAKRVAYTINDLLKVFNDLKTTVNGYSSPEQTMSKAQLDIATLAQTGIAQLGTPH